MGDAKHDWEQTRGQREMESSSRHQGGLKNCGESQAGTGTRGEELPGSTSYFSQRAGKQIRYRFTV